MGNSRVRIDTASGQHGEVQSWIDDLKRLSRGDEAVARIAACGDRAVPALRAVLFEREPSGLFQVRCRAIDALRSIRAIDVLIEFLTSHRDALDAVERLGDDAVVDAAALALAGFREERIFQTLLLLAQHRLTPGVVGALGAFRRREAIPHLVAALAEDDCRNVAETALRKIRRSARRALVQATTLRLPSSGRESTSSLRRRRSALVLLMEGNISAQTWRSVRHLMQDQDSRIAASACQACLLGVPTSECKDAVRRLITLLPNADWMLSNEIEECLVVYFDSSEAIILEIVKEHDAYQFTAQTEQTLNVLRRVIARGEAARREDRARFA